MPDELDLNKVDRELAEIYLSYLDPLQPTPTDQDGDQLNQPEQDESKAIHPSSARGSELAGKRGIRRARSITIEAELRPAYDLVCGDNSGQM